MNQDINRDTYPDIRIVSIPAPEIRTWCPYRDTHVVLILPHGLRHESGQLTKGDTRNESTVRASQNAFFQTDRAIFWSACRSIRSNVWA